MARAQHMIRPISMLRHARGKVMRKKVLDIEAPRLRDTFSRRGEIPSKPAFAALR